jgi:hypothetical protein
MPSGKIAAMFVDGHIRIVSAKELSELLKESQKAYDNAQ